MVSLEPKSNAYGRGFAGNTYNRGGDMRLVIPGQPMPKKRPRFAGKRVYSPSKADI